METILSQRKRTRWEGYDYNSAGAYFITICTQNRRTILSRVTGGGALDNKGHNSVGGDVLDAPQIELLHYGKIAEKYINQLNDFYEDMAVDQYVIMPNHIHIMLFVLEGGASRTSPSTKQHSSIPRFVSTFKRFCNKEFGFNIWQRGFNDHVIRNYEDYREHLKYIYENPVRWHYDELYGNN